MGSLYNGSESTKDPSWIWIKESVEKDNKRLIRMTKDGRTHIILSELRIQVWMSQISDPQTLQPL